MEKPSVFRVGVVPYLNMLPFVHGMDDLSAGGAQIEVHAVTPRRMTEMLGRGELEIGMVPVGGLVEHPEWRIAGRTMIGARGPVRSVIAVGAGPPENWTALHPDSHSRTSNALAQVLLRGRFGANPQLVDALPERDWTPPERLQPGEAFVLIGTRALRWHEPLKERGLTVVDLGKAWTDWTGLPFVFAAWCARPDVEAQPWMKKIEDLTRRNLERIEEIVAQWPGLSEEDMSADDARDYLTRSIRYELDESALEGLERFYAAGVETGVFKKGWRLNAAWTASSLC